MPERVVKETLDKVSITVTQFVGAQVTAWMEYATAGGATHTGRPHQLRAAAAADRQSACVVTGG